MSQTYDSDFELIFINNYDENVIAKSVVPDKGQVAFKNAIVESISKTNVVLSIYKGVAVMSSFVDYNNNRYKVTVKRS